MYLSIILSVPILIALTLCIYIKNSFNYWKKRNIPFITPEFPQGSLRGIGQQYHVAELMEKFYYQMKGKAPFGGFFSFIKPSVIALDLDFIKRVMIKDFNYFHDRGVYHNERDDPLSGHLFALSGAKWKRMRAKLSPTFTSGKIKYMFPTIIKVANEFNAAMTKSADSSEELDVRDIVARYTTDVIGTCAFGIDCNSLVDPKAEFRQIGKRFLEMPRYPFFVRLFLNAFGDLGRMFRIKIVDDKVSQFILRVVNETTEYRERTKSTRNDFMDLLLQLKNDETSDCLSIGEMGAQAFVFYVAGFETSSTLMSFCLNELAVHQTIQQRVRDEVETVLKKYSGELTYEAVMELRYTDQVLNGTLQQNKKQITLECNCVYSFRNA